MFEGKRQQRRNEEKYTLLFISFYPRGFSNRRKSLSSYFHFILKAFTQRLDASDLGALTNMVRIL